MKRLERVTLSEPAVVIMSQRIQSQVDATTSSTGAVVHPRISYEEFLRVYDGSHVEWVDGEMIQMAPVSAQHQLVAFFLSALFQHYVEDKNAGAILGAPFQMKTGPDLAGREPDILFVAEAHRDRIRTAYLAGPADLAVEIVSPDSLARDRGEKFAEYQQGGVREYWIIDPIRRVAEFHQLDGDVYRPGQLDSQGRYHSSVLPGLWVEPDWFWQEPLPKLQTVLKLWNLI